MRWIGQHIWSFISRFRSDVYLESVDSGTIASGGNLGLDSNNKIVKSASPAGEIDLASAEVTGVLTVDHGGTGASSLTDNSVLTGTGGSAITAEANFTYSGTALSVDALTSTFTNTTNSQIIVKNPGDNTAGGIIDLKNERGGASAADGDTAGLIRFYSHDTGSNDTLCATLRGAIGEATNGDEHSTFAIDTLSGATATQTGFYLSSSAGNDVVNVDLGHGTTSTTTLAGTLRLEGDTIFAADDLNITAAGNDMNVDTDNFTIESATDLKPDLTLKTTANSNKPTRINFVKDKGAAGADNDYIGEINFTSDNAAQEQIDFVSIDTLVRLAADGAEEGKLVIGIKNTDHATIPRESFSLVSNGASTDANLGFGVASMTTIAGDLDIDGDNMTTAGAMTLTTGGAYEIATSSGTITLDSAGDIALECGGGDLTCDAAVISFDSSTADCPSFKLTNNADDATGPEIVLKNNRDGNGLEDNDVLGSVIFNGEDASGNLQAYGRIVGTVVESGHGDEAGQIAIQVSNDGSMRQGITITADKGTAQEVDVAIANGAASTTTIAGDLTVTSNAIIQTRKFSKTSDTDHDYSGDVVYFGTAGSTYAQGDICYLHTDASWVSAIANADNDGTGKLLAVALGSDPAVHGMLLRGMITLDHNTGNSNDGEPVYLSVAAAGAGQTVPPSGSNNIVRIIGYKMGDDDEIWFNPDTTWIEHA